MAKKKQFPKKKKKTYLYEGRRYTREGLVPIISRLMEEGGSNISVGKKLGVTKGVVAGIRWEFDIPSTHPPGFAHVQKSSSGFPLRYATSEANQCVKMVGEHRCGWQPVPGTLHCPRHQPRTKKSK